MADDVVIPSADPATELPVAIKTIPALSVSAEVVKKIVDELPIKE
jgi:hypothetical protein